MLFANKKEFKFAIINWSLTKGFDLKFVKSEKHRVKGRCMNNKNCPVKVRGSKVKFQPTFQLRSMRKRHKCSKTLVNR